MIPNNTSPAPAPDGEGRFRKKPVEVEAWQWDGVSTAPERPEWLNGKVKVDHHEQTMAITTLEGTMIASVGDWIIRGVKGELYPIKPDIFAETYELAALATAKPETPAHGGVETALRAALSPFADAAEELEPNHSDSSDIWESPVAMSITAGHLRAALAALTPPATVDASSPVGHVEIAHDGFAGDIIGHYVTREGKRGVVVQQDGTRVVHVYGEKWLAPSPKAVETR